MPKIPTLWLPVLLLALVSLASCSEPSRDTDVDRLADYIDEEQSYGDDARRQARAALPDLRAKAPEMSDAEFFLAVARQVARADNGHSNVLTRTIPKRFGLLPVRVYWFSDGPHAVRARVEYEDLLGGKIVAVAGVPMAEAERRMKAYHGGPLEHFRSYYAPFYLLSPPLLHAEGIAPEPGRVELTLRFDDGQERTVGHVVDPESHRVAVVRPWRLLNPKALDGEGKAWRTAVSGSVPLYLDEPGKAYRLRMLKTRNPGTRTAYLQLRTNYAHERRSVRDYLEDLRARLAEDAPTHVILDMRQNPGGDLSRSAEFMLDLPGTLPPDGRIYVLTGNATFSAGIYSSFYPKAAAPGRTLILGERVGDRERFWAESADPVILGGGHALSISLQMHDLGAGCFDESVCHMLQYPESWNIAVGSFEPDMPVPTTFADYVARRDPPLETALALISEEGGL